MQIKESETSRLLYPTFEVITLCQNLWVRIYIEMVANGEAYAFRLDGDFCPRRLELALLHGPETDEALQSGRRLVRADVQILPRSGGAASGCVLAERVRQTWIFQATQARQAPGTMWENFHARPIELSCNVFLGFFREYGSHLLPIGH